MKLLFEGGVASRAMRLHLDRCLLCRACETTCPSGVKYSALLEISKTTLDAKLPRSIVDRVGRRLIGRVVTDRKLLRPLLRLGRYFKLRYFNLPYFSGRRFNWMMPKVLTRGLPKGLIARLANAVPDAQPPLGMAWPPPRHPRKMLVLAGCVQPLMAPNTNLAAAVVLDRLGISLLEVGGAGCCGGVALHTSGESDGKVAARALIDRWWPHLPGVEAIVMTASGCGVTVKEYPRLFADEPAYREKALRVSEKTVDLCELIARELPPGYVPSGASSWPPAGAPKKVAFHAPCTLRHGQRIVGTVESILTRLGYDLCAVRDAHLCCGSAGTYSILQPTLSTRLRKNKQAALAAERPEVVCTANVGCQMQLAVESKAVLHWIELLL